MGPFILMWIIGEGIILYRSIKWYHAPPLPAEILATSGLFVVLAILAEWQYQFALLLAVGFDIAAFLALASSPPKPKCENTLKEKPPKTPKPQPNPILPGLPKLL